MKKPPPQDIDSTDALYLFDPSPTHTQFMLVRAHAIEQYAALEQELARLCAALMGVEEDVSGVLFFRLNNARSRLLAIERLLKKKHSSAYNPFFNSLHLMLRALDEERNQIVHWITVKTVTSAPTLDGPNHHWSVLAAPNYSDRTDTSEQVGLEDLYHFILKAHFSMQLVSWFRLNLQGVAKATAPTWLRIFAEPATYPPPSTHPLFRNWKAQGSPPQPSLPK